MATEEGLERRLDRWLVDGRIAVYPRRTADRRALLEHVVAQAVGGDEGLGEPELNHRLRAFTDDTATLRRYLVDHGLLVRSRDGSVYSLAMSDLRTQQVTPEQWQVWRDLRLRSLREEPGAFGSTHDREARFDEQTWRSRVDGTAGPAVVAYAGEVPVGMGAGWLYEPGRVMVVAMWTDPAWRGNGVGGLVLEHVVGWAREHGLRPDLWVADANPAARRLYERRGFRPDGLSEPLREGSAQTKTHLVL